MRTRVLFVDDDGDLCREVKLYLESKGSFEVTTASRYDEALAKFERVDPDIIVLDIMLEDRVKDGLRLCRVLQALPFYQRRPRDLLLLSGNYISDIDQELGLEIGADDYMTKPISPGVFLAKLKARQRRLDSPPVRRGVIHVSERVEVDLDRREVRVNQQVTPMPPKAYELLVYLLTPPNTVRTHDEIVAEIWKEERSEDSIYSIVLTLRKKIERVPKEPELLVRVYGVGYKLLIQE